MVTSTSWSTNYLWKFANCFLKKPSVLSIWFCVKIHYSVLFRTRLREFSQLDINPLTVKSDHREIFWISFFSPFVVKCFNPFSFWAMGQAATWTFCNGLEVFSWGLQDVGRSQVTILGRIYVYLMELEPSTGAVVLKLEFVYQTSSSLTHIPTMWDHLPWCGTAYKSLKDQVAAQAWKCSVFQTSSEKKAFFFVKCSAFSILI